MIRDVHPGSQIRIVSNPDPDPETKESKKHRIPDPDPHTLYAERKRHNLDCSGTNNLSVSAN
jgi:hypothetical protein